MQWDDWRFSAKRAWQNSFIRWTVIATALVIVAGTFFILWRLIPEGLRSGVLVMHYNIYLGIDYVRPWQWIILIPAVMILTFLINTFLALWLYRPDELASKTLVAVTAVLTVLWCIGSFFLVLVNL